MATSAIGAARRVVDMALSPVDDGLLEAWATGKNSGLSIEAPSMDALLGAAQWAVGKALSPVADGLLEAWAGTKNLGFNIEALRMELLRVKATLEIASHKELRGEALKELLGALWNSVDSANNLLGELDYFRIHDMLHGSYNAADEQAKGGVHDLALNARHTAKAVGKLACLPRARGCLPKLGKLLPCSSSPQVHGDDYGQPPTLRRVPRRETPMLAFNRADLSERMKHIIEQLQPVRTEVTMIQQSCGRMTVPDIVQTRPITTSESIEPTLYGRDHIMDTIIHDMTKGKYLGTRLSVLPIVGLGGIGKTTLVQHIYHSKQVQGHFQVMIWVCVSLDFNLHRLFEEIKTCIPRVEGEREGTPEELIEQRLKSKRFLLVLDDIWMISADDQERLLLPLKTSEENGSMVLVTTRFPSTARMIGTTNRSVQLEGLETEEFTKLFFTLVFGNEQCARDHSFLLATGDKIMNKLRGSPLAAKTVGRLLRNNLNLDRWKKVLENREWENQTGFNDIMPALKLSHDYLPFHLQLCFYYSALFPEGFRFSSSQLINLWIGLDILQHGAPNQTFEDIGLRYLNDLVACGIFREEESNGHPCYVMHDLLYDLALKVASHECLTLRRSNAGLVDIHPSIRHLSIIIDDDNAVFGETFKTELKKLKTRLKVQHLQTLMIFGEMDEIFTNMFGDLFREANALCVLHLPEMSYPVESMLHNFSALIHLRYLCLGTKNKGLMHRFLCPGTEYESQMHLPLAISRFYHLRILDIGSWYGHCDFPGYMSNLTKLCHFVTQEDELHSDICNVGKLKLLEELKVFRVNKECEGFETKQLEPLTKLMELGIYNLEKIRTEEEAAQAKLMKKRYLRRLTLEWDSERSSVEPGVEAVVLESLQPHGDLQVLHIRGHGGSSCPTWLGDEFAVEALGSLYLDGVSWEVFPSLGKARDLHEIRLEDIARPKEFIIEECFCRLTQLIIIGLGSFEKWVYTGEQESSLDGALLPPDAHMFPLLQVLIIRDCPKLLGLPFSNHIGSSDWFPKLQELEIQKCPELLSCPLPWTETLCSVSIRGVRLLEKLVYSNSSHGVRLDIVGKDDLHSLDQVLAFINLTELEELALVKCPPLELSHLVMLTSLKTLTAESSDALVEALGGQGDVEWQLPVEHIEVQELCGNSGRDLTELLTHLPGLSKLKITDCGKITHLNVGVDLQQKISAASEVEKDEMPSPAAAAAEAEQEKEDGLLLFPAHLSNKLSELVISHCPELVLLPDGGGWLQSLRCLQRLKLKKTPKLLSAYLFSPPSRCLFPSSLQFLELNGVEGMGTVEPLSNLTSLTVLELRNCGEGLRCKGLEPLLTMGGQLSALIVYGNPRFFAGWDPNPSSSSKLQKLWTDDVAGFLAMPVCSLLSSSLTQLQLSGTHEMESFSNEQEEALHLLTSLLKLEFFGFNKLQCLPAGLHKLTCLMELQVDSCPFVCSLPKDGLPRSLQKLDVWDCGHEELIQQCRKLVRTNPELRLEF